LAESARVPADRRALVAAVSIILSLVVAACGDTTAARPSPTEASPTAAPGASAVPEEKVVVYSGRSEELVGPLLARFEEATGIRTEVRYAGTSELAATILEEGANSPADVFFSQDGGALGALAAEDRLADLPADVLALVDPRFRSADGRWTGVSGRARG